MLNLVKTETPEPDAKALAARFTGLLAEAEAAGIRLDDEVEAQRSFLEAALAGDAEKCREIADETERRLVDARAKQAAEQKKREAAREIVSLRTRLNVALGDVRLHLSRGAIADITGEFDKFAAAGNLDACRELAERYEGVRAARSRPQWEIEAERRAATEVANKAFAEAQAKQAAEKHRQEVLRRYGYGAALTEAQKHGALRLGPNEEVIYSGAALDADLMMALEADARNVRIALRQRWQDRVVIPAPAPGVAV